MTAFLSAFYAIIKLIPKFELWFNAFYEIHLSSQLAGSENRRVEKQEKKALIMKKIQEAKSHEEKRILFSTLNDIDRV